jgi:KDO2-lipid IV(A) lauroyltransferase
MLKEKLNRQISDEPNDFHSKFASFVASIQYQHIASIGRALGLLLYFIDVRHRRIVRRNLKFIYPEWKHDHVQKMSKCIFQSLSITLLEICQMTCFSKSDIIGKANIRGEEHLLNALNDNKGAILISAHLGNWEMMAFFWPLYFKMPITVVTRQIQSRIINRWISRFRTKFGIRVIDKGGALPEMTRTLRQNKILGILIDQGTKSSFGVKITFFNKFVTATPAAALLALRCKSPVLPIFCTRNEDGVYTINIEPPLALKRTDDLHADLRTNTQIMMDVIEKTIRKYPEQWFWVHKRWRKYYPHLYPEDMARRERRKVIKNREIR